MSLKSSKVAVMLPTRDAERARTFYEDGLGLTHEDVGGSDEETAFSLDSGAQFVLRLMPDAEPSPHTVASFEVDDITAAIADLESRGVTFEDYDQEGFTTVDHVFDDGSMKAAWFLDPDGNVLCLHQPGG